MQVKTSALKPNDVGVIKCDDVSIGILYGDSFILFDILSKEIKIGISKHE